MNSVKPLKRFGQNYLKDQNILNKIVDEFDPKDGDNILEIGCGLGALTQKLIERVGFIKGVEIDTRVGDDLKEKFKDKLELIQNDFLDINLQEFASDKKLRIAGNIPYNITSPIIFKLIENREIVSDAVFMVQHEVAMRMNGVKGTKDYGIFSIILNYFCDIEYCFKVSPNVFYPKPKVASAVVHLFFKEKTDNEIDEKLFIKIVKASFGNRRKTLKNSLSNSIFKDINFENFDGDLSLRAEQLDVEDFIRLTKYAATYNK